MKLHDFQFFTLETIVIQTIILLLILWVLNRFVFKPYLAYLDVEAEKRKKFETDYNNIEKLNREALESKEKMLLEARTQAEEVRRNSADLARKEALTIKTHAEEEAGSIKKSALVEIAKEKESMLGDLRAKSIDLILKFNAKLFTSERVTKDFVEKEIASVK